MKKQPVGEEWHLIKRKFLKNMRKPVQVENTNVFDPLIPTVETIEEAISLTEKRLSYMPKFNMYRSILKQLNYMLSVVDGSGNDKSKPDKIILGHFVVREFEKSDPELSSVLIKCQNIAIVPDMEN